MEPTEEYRLKKTILQMLDDIGYGYSDLMIANKLLNRNYSTKWVPSIKRFEELGLVFEKGHAIKGYFVSGKAL